ncbi:CENP-A-nucleosome distal centromere subunit CENP-L [Penicillium paradoxum]|uniref:CENP-A-nucleosome distal centromere subunit CENP-L n=1 Tax=Penicillium paradoxum TaxID=176176 RepID=UPI002546E885|nr:CENP-A-nucleosome distal centromere subunit CENP-L [Penicillium paradoxum]KAJ5793477.1 CENP-A-nucleosome distal centromere subunit CENP-L [Penicillium paradoxum]
MEQAGPRQLFNTSWTVYRLSPLHHGKDCETLLDNQIALKTYATRLRDHLTGDVLAGLQTSTGATDEDALSKTGALKDCLWQPISPQSSARDEETSSSQEITFPGILVTLEYENITYKAALLADTGSSPNQRTGSTSVPLLLTRFPTALRQTFLAFLATNFDTYYSSLRLPSSFLCAGLDTYVDALRTQGGSGDNDTAEDVIKELQLTLSFSPSIAPALRSLNVSVARASLSGFLRDQSGQSAPKSRTLQRKLQSPLIANLTSYLETHLAMKLDLDGSSSNQTAKQHVRLSKVACSAFVLGSEGRVKLVVAADRDMDEESASQVRRDKGKLAFEAGELLLRSLIRKAALGDNPAT